MGKLKKCLPPLKTSFARELRSKVVYKLTCSVCNSTYVGQTVRYLATRNDENRKRDSQLGQHLLKSNKKLGGTAELKSEIIENFITDYLICYVITVVLILLVKKFLEHVSHFQIFGRFVNIDIKI